MSQPVPYVRSTAFADDESSNVGGRSTVRTSRVDAEFDAVALTLDQTLANLALNQRDDGEIRDGRVKAHTLAADVRSLLAIGGVSASNLRGTWGTVTAYVQIDVVTNGGNTYMCAVGHISGTFATDLAAGKWILITLGNAIGASAVTFSSTANIAATNVQAAIEESDTENRALSAAASAAVAALITNLANSGSATAGAALSGYDSDLTYAVGTVGAKLNAFVTPEDAQFGAVGNGVADDTAAIQAFYTYLAANGGIGLLGRKTYKITAQITLTSPARGFAVYGSGPESLIQLRATSAVSAFGFVNPTGIIHQGFRIDCGYSVTGFASHGMSFRNANRCTWRDIEVFDHRNAAILTFVDADDTYGDCHIINCKSDGNNNGQNGFLHEGMLRSSIQNCTVRRLSTSGSPSCGLQLKNRCKHSWIDGGFASECKSGVAMGGDGATFGDGPFNSWIRGVITKDCLDGATIGKTTDCRVEIYADQTGSPAPGVLTGYALNVAGANLNLSAVVSIKGVQTGRTCILVRSDDVSITVPYINGIGTRLLEMSAGVNRCRVTVIDVADTAVTNLNDYVLDSSGQTDNEVLFVRDLPGGGLANANYIKMPVTGKTQNWLSYSGSIDTFNFRINGTDRYGLSATALFPSVDASAALGTTARRYTNVFSQGLTLVDGVTAPSTISGHAVIYVDTADGDLKIKFADGTVKTIVTDT